MNKKTILILGKALIGLHENTDVEQVIENLSKFDWAFSTKPMEKDYTESAWMEAFTVDTEHKSHGWTIIGEIQKDYFEWRNDFVAVHETGHIVFGDFELTVYATSEKVYEHFRDHCTDQWDYGDI